MSLDNLSRELLHKAAREKDILKEELKRQKEALEQEMHEEFRLYREKELRRFETELDVRRRDIIGNAKRDAGHQVLSTKTALLAELFSKTLEELEHASGKQRESLLAHLVSLAQIHLPEYDTIYCSKEDEKIVRKLIAKTVKIETAQVKGLRASAKEGKQQLDLSFRTILLELMEEKEEEILRKSKW